MGLEEVREGVINGQSDVVVQSVEEELEAGTDSETILQESLISAMGYVGRQFERNEVFVPEMLISARAMKAGLAILKPLLVEKGTIAAGHLVIGTVQGDLHDIGKNLVAMMFEGAGFEITDLGTDVSPDEFVAAVEPSVDVLAMSALLTTTMPNMKMVIEALTEAGVRDNVKVIIGGAPVTQAYADEIGADGYSPDASAAVRTAKGLMGIE